MKKIVLFLTVALFATNAVAGLGDNSRKLKKVAEPAPAPVKVEPKKVEPKKEEPKKEEPKKEVKKAEKCQVTTADVPNPISRASFATKVEDREPVDTIKAVDENVDNIVLFTEIKNFKCGVIKHTWYNGDVEVYSQSFNITYPRYRTWTSSRPMHYEKGDTAKVVVSDGITGDEIATYTIKVK